MVMLESARRKTPVPVMEPWLIGRGIAATLAVSVAHGVGACPAQYRSLRTRVARVAGELAGQGVSARGRNLAKLGFFKSIPVGHLRIPVYLRVTQV